MPITYVVLGLLVLCVCVCTHCRHRRVPLRGTSTDHLFSLPVQEHPHRIRVLLSLKNRSQHWAKALCCSFVCRTNERLNALPLSSFSVCYQSVLCSFSFFCKFQRVPVSIVDRHAVLLLFLISLLFLFRVARGSELPPQLENNNNNSSQQRTGLERGYNHTPGQGTAPSICLALNLEIVI